MNNEFCLFLILFYYVVKLNTMEMYNLLWICCIFFKRNKVA